MTFDKNERTIIENALRFYAEEGFDGKNLQAIIAKVRANERNDFEALLYQAQGYVEKCAELNHEPKRGDCRRLLRDIRSALR